MDERPRADTEFADRSLVLEFARLSLDEHETFVDQVLEAGPQALVQVVAALCREMRRRTTDHEELAEVISQLLPSAN
jgi:hypothetical protein